MKMAQDETAVSPVIGVILMVAITVVLAAIVFAMVTGMGDQDEQGPAVGFSKDSGSLTVTKAPNGLSWADLTVVGCDTVPSGNVTAGDVVDDCAGKVTIRHDPSNSLIYTTDF